MDQNVTKNLIKHHNKIKQLETKDEHEFRLKVAQNMFHTKYSKPTLNKLILLSVQEAPKFAKNPALCEKKLDNCIYHLDRFIHNMETIYEQLPISLLQYTGHKPLVSSDDDTESIHITNDPIYQDEKEEN